MITVLFLHSGVNYLHAFSLIFCEIPNTKWTWQINVSHSRKSSFCVKQDMKITSVSKNEMPHVII